MSTVNLDERGLILQCPNCRQHNRAVFGRLKESFRCSKCQTQLALPAEPIVVPSETAFNALVQSSAIPVLMDFWAAWCGPCKMVAPELVKIAASNQGKWLICKADIDVLQGVATRYNIASIPTMTVFNKGREVARQSGAMGAPGIQRFMDSAPG